MDVSPKGTRLSTTQNNSEGQPEKKRRLSRISNDWCLELCTESDETLQIGKRLATSKKEDHHTTNGNFHENTFDSYRLETLATAQRSVPVNIENSMDDDASHWCDTTISAKLAAVTMGSQIYILTADCRKQVTVIHHESRIVATALNSDSSFVAFGDDSGVLVIVHIDTRRPVFSQNIQSLYRQQKLDSAVMGICALKFAVSGTSADGASKIEELVLATRDGELVRFSNIKLCQLGRAILDGDMSTANSIKSDIVMEPTQLVAGEHQLYDNGITDLSIVHAENSSDIFVSGDGDACLSCWQRREASPASHMDKTKLIDMVSVDSCGSGYTKTALSLDQKYVIALGQGGALDVYDRQTLTHVFRYSDIEVDDFAVLAHSSASNTEAVTSSSSILVAAISKPIQIDSGDEEDEDEDQSCRRLIVVSLPSMDLIYTMDVSVWSWLALDIRQVQDIAENILFIEGEMDGETQIFYLRSLCETLPMDRLSHYLRMGRYDEAERFANNCDIPLAVVYRHRLGELLNDPENQLPSSLDSEGAIEEFIQHILHLLSYIEDVPFAIDVSLRLPIPSLECTYRLLKHARHIASDRDEHKSHLSRVIDTIQRLGTWKFLAGDVSFNAQGWHIFREIDLATCIRSYIAKGDITRASIIWRRHRDDKRLFNDISTAIQSFPITGDTHALTGWLQKEILPFFQTRQQWLDLASWIEQRARILESTHGEMMSALNLIGLTDIGCWSTSMFGWNQRDYATSALSLGNNNNNNNKNNSSMAGYGQLTVTPQRHIESSLSSSSWMSELAHFSGAMVFSIESDSGGNPNSSIAALDSDSISQSCLFLRKQLLDMVRLRQKHNMYLTLGEFEQMSYSTVAVELLDRVAAPELLHSAYFDHFVPYAEHHNLDYAQILHKYCVEIMDDTDREEEEEEDNDMDDNGEDENKDSVMPEAFGIHIGGSGSNGRRTWEPRVIALLSCLFSSCIGIKSMVADASKQLPLLPLTSTRLDLLKTYFDTLLEVMRRSSIPWSVDVDTLISRSIVVVKEYASIDSELERCHLEVVEQFRLMRLKRMLLSHGLPDFHISNTKMALPLLQWLVRKTDSDSIMDDVLQLVDAYHHLSRTSAYVLRLQALCEAEKTDLLGELIYLVDLREHGSKLDSGPSSSSGQNSRENRQPIQKYVVLEVVRRGIIWIREVLDSMDFVGETNPVQFRNIVGAAMAILGALDKISRKYRTATQQQEGQSLSTSEMLKLEQFISKESGIFNVVWQLMVDGEIMVSPGELDQQSTREQILTDLLERRWLATYANTKENHSDIRDSKLGKSGARNKGKGKEVDIMDDEDEHIVAYEGELDMEKSGSGCPVELVSLPPIPPSIRNLANMVNFSYIQLGRLVVSRCLGLGLYTMALDMCQSLIGKLDPAATQSSDGWSIVLLSLVSCERRIGAFLAGLASIRFSNNGSRRSDQVGRIQDSLVCRLSFIYQAASLKCASQPQLPCVLDAYACWELAQAIFSQTTDGDFAVLTRSLPANADADSQSTTDTDDSKLSIWLNPLYTNTYVERGLVLDTDVTMKMVYRLVSALRRMSTAGFNSCNGSDSFSYDPPNGASSSKGKIAVSDLDSMHSGDEMSSYVDVEDIRRSVIRRCNELVLHLSKNRHWMLAVHALELTISQLARFCFAASIGSAEATEGMEHLNDLRQMLVSGGLTEDELALLFREKEDSGSESAKTPNSIQDLMSQSLTRSMQQRGIDATFIFSAMLMAETTFAYHQLSMAMSHSGLLPARVISLANIGTACSLVWKQHGLLERCRSVAAAARWSDQLRLLELNFKVDQLTNPKPEVLEPLVRPMLIKTAMDITTVLEFAEAFKLNETFVILEYISLCCSTPNIDGYQARVLGISNEIANTKLLERTFVDSLENAMSAYDYERLQFVVQRLQELRPHDEYIAKSAAVLDILCSYDRQSKPTYDELLQEWTRTLVARNAIKQGLGNKEVSSDKMDTNEPTYQEMAAECPLAFKRLPFHSIVSGNSSWTALLPELTTETVEMLLPLAAPLGLSEDDFYINLIDGTLKQWATDSGDSTSSFDPDTVAYEQAISKSASQFAAVERLIRCCRDPEATISTIKHVAEELPCGPNRVAALNFGLKVLNKWGQLIKRMAKAERDEVESRAKTIYADFSKSLSDAKIEIVLRSNRLEQYLPAFANVQDYKSALKALTKVFEGECEVALAKLGYGSGVDDGGIDNRHGSLYGILRDMAATYEIGMDKLTQDMLTKYLLAPVAFSESVGIKQLPSIRYHATVRSPESQEATLNRRIVYLLRVQSVTDAATTLLDFAYKRPNVPFLCRVRALEILLSLVSEENIAELIPPKDVHRYLQALLYVADFEHVGIRQSTADFLSCQKDALARSVWIEHHEDPKVVQLICNLCLDFEVDDGDLVLRMLPQLLSASMFRYVLGALDIISSMECYMSIGGDLLSIWSQAVVGCLLEISESSLSSAWVDEAVAILELCVRSAFLPSIDLLAIINALLDKRDDGTCVQLAFATFTMLSHGNDGEVERRLTGYIGAKEPKQLHELITGILDFGERASAIADSHIFVDWITSGGLTLVFDVVDSLEIHEQVLLLPPLGRVVYTFVQNRIHHDRMLAVIRGCLSRDKKQMAAQLVTQYYQLRPPETLARDASLAGITPEDSNNNESMAVDSPASTQDITAAIQKLADQFTSQQKLDIYISVQK